VILIRRHIRGITYRPTAYPWPIWTCDPSTARIRRGLARHGLELADESDLTGERWTK